MNEVSGRGLFWGGGMDGEEEVIELERRRSRLELSRKATFGTAPSSRDSHSLGDNRS